MLNSHKNHGDLYTAEITVKKKLPIKQYKINVRLLYTIMVTFYNKVSIVKY